VTSLSQPARDLTWLINNFNERVPGVAHAVVVSSDGLLLVASCHLPADNAEALAAIVCSLASITTGAAGIFGEHTVLQTVVEMPGGFLLVRSVRDGSVLATLAKKSADIGLVGYEMTKLAKQAGEMLTPELRRELRPGILSG
jgi:hypothetical protein